jgi:putative transposase
VNWLCTYMKVSTSGYYAWRTREASARAQQNQELLTAIKRLHNGDRRCYGSPRVHLELLDLGYVCGRHRVARLMRAHGIVAERERRYRSNRARDELYARFENRLLQRGPAARPDELWVGDYTYLRTPQGWLYLAVVLDLYARRVVGWAFSRQRTANLPREALRMAIDERKPPAGTLFHSDQGIEYAAHTFQSLIAAHKLEPSMSRKGNCYDNAHMESFFASMKLEIGGTFKSAADAISKIRSYIQFYNHERRHSSLHYQSPVHYERLGS